MKQYDFRYVTGLEERLAIERARALTAEARVAQLERAISDDPLESERLRATNTIQGDQLTSLMQDNVECGNEVARLRAAIHEAAAKLAGRPHNAPQPVLEALIQLVLDDLCEAEDADYAHPTPD